jgi:chemotaxis protein CheZ
LSSDSALINLEQARQLVALLEQNDTEAANQLVESSTQQASEELFAEVGKLTRQLHDSIHNFQLDPRLSNLAKEDIPDAKNRLLYVMEKTEQAANKTMDAVEASLPIATQLSENIAAVIPTWDKLMTRKIDIGEFKRLCHSIDDILRSAEGDSELLKNQLNDVLMAQDFQDLTGQVIRRVIELVREVEDNLIHLLTVFGTTEKAENKKDMQSQVLDEKAEGPIIDSETRNDVVSGQDDVDDLLSSLGF